jgi:hypothetical protein
MTTTIAKRSSKEVRGSTAMVRSHLDKVERARQLYLDQIKRAEVAYFDRIKAATEEITGEHEPAGEEAEARPTQ